MPKSLNQNIFLLFVFLTSEVVSGQSYISFPDSNAVWCGQRSQLYFNPPNDQIHTWTYQQYISGDTVINSIVYHKLEENGVFEWEDYPIPMNIGSSTYFHQYVGCIREDSKIIYYVPPTSQTENYLYNFNFNVGDTLPSNILTPSNYTMITRIDSIQISGNYRKQFFVSVVDTIMWQWSTHFEYVSIIEGIGSTNGLNWTVMPYFERGGTLWAFKHNGIVVYTDSIATSCAVTGVDEMHQLNQIEVFPNPTRNVLNIQTAIPDQLNLILVNLVGKVVFKSKIINSSSANQISLNSLPGGIYILHLFNDYKTYTSIKLSMIKD